MPLTLKATNGNRGVAGIWGGFEVRSGFSATRETWKETAKLGNWEAG